jgi:SAM-dependent methyltransferase
LRDTCPVCEQAAPEEFQVVKELRYLRCPVCLATLMAPENRLDSAREKAVYTLHENNPDDPGYRRFLSRLSEPLLERLPFGSSGLDFGCGPGPTLARMLEAAGMKVALYDPYFSPDQSALASCYDFVTCTEVIEHLYHPAAVFRQLDSLIRPGGYLGVMTCFQTDDARFANWHYRRDPTHVVFYKEATLQWLADHHGWHLDVPAKDVAIFTKPLRT